VWVSDVDATDEGAGIHCGPVNPLLSGSAGAIARRLLRLLVG
jgi:hypothetical protein